MKTYVAKPAEVERKWYVIDAEDQVLGRMATVIASILRGKHKPEFTPFVDTGDFVIVVNASKVRVSGNKETQKIYRRHSLYPGGLKEINFQEMQEKHPERIIKLAVKGMLPKNALGRQMIKKLKVHSGPEHTQEAQKPEVWEIK
ncbi:MAG TPA: 50S ribosomal protein L13 [Candidatus Eisenbacteria bacterium]|nr:50S ribosomal protein L13 [Candidatus Eisenbacteria bacterium]